MARIGKIRIIETENSKRCFGITFDNGESMLLSFADAGIIKEQMLLEELRCGIRNVIDDEIAEGNLDLARGEVSREDFEDEIYDDLQDDISCGEYAALCNDGEYIREKVNDLAVFYGLEPDDEEGSDNDE